MKEGFVINSLSTHYDISLFHNPESALCAISTLIPVSRQISTSQPYNCYKVYQLVKKE